MPLLISTGNSEAVVGQPWRWVRDHAPLLGVPVRKVGRKGFVEADALLGAMRRLGAPEGDATPAAEESADPAERVRAALGKRRRVQ